MPPLIYGSRSLPFIFQEYITLLPRRVLLIGLGHMSLLVVTMVDEYAVTQGERFAQRDGPAPVVIVVPGKFPDAKRIYGKQSVASRVPIRWMAEALRAVKNGNPQLFIAHLSIIIPPTGARSPDLLVAYATFGIHHVPRRRVELFHDADGK